ncbi:nucleolar protein 56 [Anopheles funestus]|uniref:nucleolar protein 56 n=1 Tax=Anopheles funestus TaxID=62324 RepID=UPI0020C5F7DE|nr:nucleolar protein 56 [Anopheles funestus]
MALFVLYEHAAGYGLFSVKEFEEIGMLLPQVEASILDLARFNAIIKLVGFHPFKTAVAALNNVNAISEGLLPDDLSSFLDTSLPKSAKKKPVTLGVGDAKLGAAIAEALNVQCSHIGAVPEILRGIRHHFGSMVKGFTDKSAAVAQLGLGHSYSRCKVKFNVHRSDNMIIQSIALLDQLDKDVNTFSMRIREWYSYHFPELSKIVPDNYLFAKVAFFVKDRKTLTDESLPGLEEILMDSEKAEAVVSAARMSMGMDISMVDLINIEMFAKRVIKLSDYRQQLSGYLQSKMNCVAPNLQALIGDQVGARLISKAGSLTNLAKFPASTVQILGAEKALFRALKTKSNTPKYGLLFNSSFIGRANAKNKGRISRFLANKCTIACRIDCFTETPSNVFGEALKGQVEERLRFYEQGEVPRKNLDVMKEAMSELGQQVSGDGGKKKNKRKLEDTNGNGTEMNGTAGGNSAKKRKKSKLNDTNGDDANGSIMLDTSSNQMDVSNGEGKKKKKKNKNRESVAEV